MLVCSLLSVLDATFCLFAGRCIGKQLVFTLRSTVQLPSALVLTVEYAVIVGLTLLVTLMLRKPITKILRYLVHKKRRFVGLGALTLTVGFVLGDRDVASALVLVVLSVLAFATYESMDYEHYMMLYLRKNLGPIARLWLRYFFDSTSGLSFKAVLYWTQRVAGEEISVDSIGA
jgi:hypothetical protein